MSDAQRDVRHGVVRAVGSIGLATLLSRILGFVRDMVVARAFGAGPVTDAFFVAFRIPNLLRRLLAEGALSTAFIPVFTSSLTHDGRAGFRRMLRAVAGATAVALCAVSVLGMLAAPWIVRVMAPGWTSDIGRYAWRRATTVHRRRRSAGLERRSAVEHRWVRVRDST